MYDARGHQFIYDVTFARMGHDILIKKYLQVFLLFICCCFVGVLGVLFFVVVWFFFVLLDLYTCML